MKITTYLFYHLQKRKMDSACAFMIIIDPIYIYIYFHVSNFPLASIKERKQ